MPGKKSLDDFTDVESDERFIRVQERYSRAEARKKMFDQLSMDMEKELKLERKDPRPVLSKVERRIHHKEQDWRAAQRKLEDLKLQSKIRKSEIKKAQQEFLHLIHKDVDLENPVALNPTRVESAKKKLVAKIQHVTKEVAKLEKEIPGLIQEELDQRGRFEKLRIQKESIRSGFRNLPLEKDPRMTSFHRERHKLQKEYNDLKVERDEVTHKVRREKKRKRGSQPVRGHKKTNDDKEGRTR